MKQPSSVLAELDDWGILSSFLPEGWQQKARECGALTRARGIAGPDALLRILLIHIANGCSLAETSVRAGQLGLGQLNQSAVYKRLRSAEEWLRWMAEQMRASLGFTAPKLAQRVRAVDATTITEPGSTGTDWRIHYAINLANLQCDFFQLTDVKGGEAWRRFPVMKGDIMLGDRGYANPNGVAHVVEPGGEVVVRLNRKSLPLFDKEGNRLNAVHLARGLRPNQKFEWEAWVQTGRGKKVGSLQCHVLTGLDRRTRAHHIRSEQFRLQVTWHFRPAGHVDRRQECEDDAAGRLHNHSECRCEGILGRGAARRHCSGRHRRATHAGVGTGHGDYWRALRQQSQIS